MNSYILGFLVFTHSACMIKNPVKAWNNINLAKRFAAIVMKGALLTASNHHRSRYLSATVAIAPNIIRYHMKSECYHIFG